MPNPTVNPNPSVPTRPKPDHPKPETRGTRNVSGGFGMNFHHPKPDAPEPDAPEPEKSDPCAPLVVGHKLTTLCYFTPLTRLLNILYMYLLDRLMYGAPSV